MTINLGCGDVKTEKRLQQEKKTVELMIRIYCKSKDNYPNSLCPECKDLLDYSLLRLDNCKMGVLKPVCGKCKIHCYEKGMREKIKEVMRNAGPKMIFFHPILTIRHLLHSVNLSVK